MCFALCQLAAGFKVNAPTSLLSPYFKDIVQALLEAVCPFLRIHDSTADVYITAQKAFDDITRHLAW